MEGHQGFPPSSRGGLRRPTEPPPLTPLTGMDATSNGAEGPARARMPYGKSTFAERADMYRLVRVEGLRPAEVARRYACTRQALHDIVKAGPYVITSAAMGE